MNILTDNFLVSEQEEETKHNLGFLATIIYVGITRVSDLILSFEFLMKLLHICFLCLRRQKCPIFSILVVLVCKGERVPLINGCNAIYNCATGDRSSVIYFTQVLK